MLKINRAESATPKAKLFTAKPLDFTIDASNGARFTAKLRTDDKTYDLTVVSGRTAYDAAGLRELADHLGELADIAAGKIKFAA